VVVRRVQGSREADAAREAVLARAAAGKRGTLAFDQNGDYIGDG